MKLIDLVGKKYGLLTVVSRAKNKGEKVCWNVLCECGKTSVVMGGHIKLGKTKSCGCKEGFYGHVKDLSGKNFGRLTALYREGTRSTKPLWVCRCRCGVVKSITGNSLLRGDTKSCGCLLAESFIGSRNPNWRGGISYLPYSTDWTKTLKNSIRERDNFSCQMCDKAQGEETFPVHHIDYDKKNCDPENLVTLCNSCHGKTNFNREKWQQHFKNNAS